MITVRPAVAPFGLLFIKAVAAAVFLLLLIYSVVVEIPLALRDTPTRRTGPPRTVASGSYGIVRHPGFIWFALLWASIVVMYLDPLVTAVGLGLVAIDFVLIVIEDFSLFPRIFSDYAEYKKRVPFLIPRIRRK